MACVTDISGNTSPSSGYFEQRSPKYLSHQSSPRKFVFDAVSPRHESIGKWYHVEQKNIMSFPT